MAGIDLTEAIEAAADALCDVIDAGIQPCRAHGRIHRDHNGRRFCDASRADVSGIVQAAAPIIERQVAERIAERIENHSSQHEIQPSEKDCDVCYGLEIAAHIAREVGSDG